MSTRFRSLLVFPVAAVAVLASLSVAAANPKTAADDDGPTKEQVIEQSKEPLFPAEDPPALTGVQAALAERITTLSTPLLGAKSDDYGLPTELSLGIVGFYADAPGHYTVIAGAKSDIDTLLQLVLSPLPAEAKSFLTIQKSTAAISDLTKVWVDATKASWRTSPSTYAMILNPRTSKVELTVSELTDAERQRLTAIGGDLLDIKVDGHTSRDTRAVSVALSPFTTTAFSVASTLLENQTNVPAFSIE